jgi:hypothetical protein
VFEIEWDKMDGIKGSSRKGTRAFDKVAVVWKVVEVQGGIAEPFPGQAAGKEAADWKQNKNEAQESSDEEEKGLKPHVTRE